VGRNFTAKPAGQKFLEVECSFKTNEKYPHHNAGTSAGDMIFYKNHQVRKKVYRKRLVTKLPRKNSNFVGTQDPTLNEFVQVRTGA
jgi:hypothetical protein